MVDGGQLGGEWWLFDHGWWWLITGIKNKTIIGNTMLIWKDQHMFNNSKAENNGSKKCLRIMDHGTWTALVALPAGAKKPLAGIVFERSVMLTLDQQTMGLLIWAFQVNRNHDCRGMPSINQLGVYWSRFSITSTSSLFGCLTSWWESRQLPTTGDIDDTHRML